MSSTSEVSEDLQYRLRYASAIFFRLHDPTDRATLGGLFESENLRQLGTWKTWHFPGAIKPHRLGTVSVILALP